MIVITGAAGFIASCLVGYLNEKGFHNLILVDDFNPASQKRLNLEGKKFVHQIARMDFPEWFENHASDISFVYHLGARTDTTEFDVELLNTLNLAYSKKIFNICATHNIPLVYASSAATYGLGEWGFEDRDELALKLKPLNPYGDSKNDFDKWVLSQQERPDSWKGIKFFNVYGPNEYHKGRMASVIFHTFNQVKQTGAMKLFRSHHPDYPDGGQLRDFIYVKDVVAVLAFLMEAKVSNGLYNLGTGVARSFLDLAKATFHAMELAPQISFIDTPEDIRDKYQYFTEAKMEKLRLLGYQEPFTTLEDGVRDYVQNYLLQNKIY
jgi:ADP-L-glycero-D-manno-heptose 6-epimerase